MFFIVILALSGWPNSAGLYFHRKKDVSGKDTLPDRDFMALNRSAVQAGLTTAPQHYQFRATHDFRRKIQTDEGKQKMTRRLPPTMVFGISTRYAVTILMHLKYQRMNQIKLDVCVEQKLTKNLMYGMNCLPTTLTAVMQFQALFKTNHCSKKNEQTIVTTKF